jgi:hypothetical protein
MKRLRKLWGRLKAIFKKTSKNPFLLSESITASVSPVELQVYRIDADRNGKNLGEWIRDTLNNGVSQQTLVHLKKGSTSRQDSIDAVYKMLDDEDVAYIGAPILPIRKIPSKMPKKLSGHPCMNLDANVPTNFTGNECQGVCTSRQPGMQGKACFWSSLVAKQCDAFEAKHVLNTRLPVKK